MLVYSWNREVLCTNLFSGRRLNPGSLIPWHHLPCSDTAIHLTDIATGPLIIRSFVQCTHLCNALFYYYFITEFWSRYSRLLYISLYISLPPFTRASLHCRKTESRHDHYDSRFATCMWTKSHGDPVYLYCATMETSLRDMIKITWLSSNLWYKPHLSRLKNVVHSDVVGASPVGAAPTTSSFSTWHLASMDWTKTTARRDEIHLSFGNWCAYFRGLTAIKVTLIKHY